MLHDVIAPDLLLLFCGTAAGKESAARMAYYAGPGNRFWRILHETGLTPRQFDPQEYAKLLDCRIGLTDIVKGQAGNDDEIDFAGSSGGRLKALIRKYRPRVLCFNGKKSAHSTRKFECWLRGVYGTRGSPNIIFTY